MLNYIFLFIKEEFSFFRTSVSPIVTQGQNPWFLFFRDKMVYIMLMCTGVFRIEETRRSLISSVPESQWPRKSNGSES